MKVIFFPFFAGPERWSRLGYNQCSGQRQSPINVVTNRVIRRHFKPIEFENFNQIPEEMNMTNNFHSGELESIDASALHNASRSSVRDCHFLDSIHAILHDAICYNAIPSGY